MTLRCLVCRRQLEPCEWCRARADAMAHRDGVAPEDVLGLVLFVAALGFSLFWWLR